MGKLLLYLVNYFPYIENAKKYGVTIWFELVPAVYTNHYIRMLLKFTPNCNNVVTDYIIYDDKSNLDTEQFLAFEMSVKIANRKKWVKKAKSLKVVVETSLIGMPEMIEKHNYRALYSVNLDELYFSLVKKSEKFLYAVRDYIHI